MSEYRSASGKLLIYFVCCFKLQRVVTFIHKCKLMDLANFYYNYEIIFIIKFKSIIYKFDKKYIIVVPGNDLYIYIHQP